MITLPQRLLGCECMPGVVGLETWIGFMSSALRDEAHAHAQTCRHPVDLKAS